MTDSDFVALEQQRTQALVQRDLPTCLALHAPDYQLITPGGAAFTREQYLGKLERDELVYLGWDLGEVTVLRSHSLAVLRYRATLTLAGGTEQPFEVWHTDAYELLDGHWQARWSLKKQN